MKSQFLGTFLSIIVEFSTMSNEYCMRIGGGGGGGGVSAPSTKI